MPHLPEQARVTVVTNAISVCYALSSRPDVEGILLGGYLRHSELTLLGPMAEEAIGQFRFDQALYGCFGLDPEDGLSGASLVETAMDRAVIASVERLMILADHTKFSQRGPVRLAEVPRISTLVMDAGAPEEGVRRLKDQEWKEPASMNLDRQERKALVLVGAGSAVFTRGLLAALTAP